MVSHRVGRFYAAAAIVGLVIVNLSLTPAEAAGGREELFIRKGVDLRKKGKNEAALAEFTKAFELAHTPRAAAQLGLCEQALSKWIDANLHLSVALAADTDSWVTQNKATLESSLEAVQKHLGRLDFDGQPGDAMVVVDRDMLGRLSDKPNVFVEPGKVNVHVTADGFEGLNEVRLVEAGSSAKVHVNLAPAAAKLLAGTDKAAVPPQGHESDIATASTEPNASSRTPSLGAWIGWGGGAVLMGAGVVFGLQSLAKADDAKSSERYSQSAVDDAKSARRLEWVFLGAGTVAVAIGTYLYFRGPGDTKVAVGGGLLANATVVNWQGGW